MILTMKRLRPVCLLALLAARFVPSALCLVFGRNRLPPGNPAWPYTMDDLGAGGGNGWGLPVHEEYRLLHKDRHEFALALRSLKAGAR